MTDDLNTVPDTGRHMLRTLAERDLSPDERSEPATKGEITVLAKALDSLRTERESDRGARRVVIGIVGAVVSGGILWLTYVSTGASAALANTDRIDRIEAVTEHNAASIDRLDRETRDRLDPMMVTLTRIETRVEALLRTAERGDR